MRKIVVSQFIQIRKCFKASNQRLLVQERADRKGTHAYFMPSQGNLLLYGKYCTSAACVYARCMPDRELERKKADGLSLLAAFCVQFVNRLTK